MGTTLTCAQIFPVLSANAAGPKLQQKILYDIK